jgi:hypothetical protein
MAADRNDAGTRAEELRRRGHADFRTPSRAPCAGWGLEAIRYPLFDLKFRGIGSRLRFIPARGRGFILRPESGVGSPERIADSG